MLVLANLLSVVGPSGAGWSFRGNGALVVPFGLGPAVLVAGWVALILHARGHSLWLLLGIAAGLLELAVVMVSVAALVLGGSRAGAIASGVGELIQLLWMLAAPVMAAFIPVGVRSPRSPTVWHVVAGIVLPFALILGFMLAGLFWRI
jgi:hypothetical protein